MGAAAAMRDEDWIFPSSREFAAALWRGMTLVAYAHHAFGTARDPGRGPPGAALRPAGDEDRADGLDRRGEFGPGRPQHDDAMAGDEADLARGTECKRVATNDDHRRDRGGLGWRRHRLCAQPSAPSPDGGG